MKKGMKKEIQTLARLVVYLQMINYVGYGVLIGIVTGILIYRI